MMFNYYYLKYYANFAIFNLIDYLVEYKTDYLHYCYYCSLYFVFTYFGFIYFIVIIDFIVFEVDRIKIVITAITKAMITI